MLKEESCDGLLMTLTLLATLNASIRRKSAAMKPADYDSLTLNPIEILVDDAAYTGTYRVMTGSVMVYYGVGVKFASIGIDRPDLVAKWLLTDLVRRAESGKRKRPQD
jgi:hypothetical protein